MPRWPAQYSPLTRTAGCAAAGAPFRVANACQKPCHRHRSAVAGFDETTATFVVKEIKNYTGTGDQSEDQSGDWAKGTVLTELKLDPKRTVGSRRQNNGRMGRASII